LAYPEALAGVRTDFFGILVGLAATAAVVVVARRLGRPR
jgi:hypothetical protein